MLYRITRHTALTSAHRPRLIESTHTTTILTRRGYTLPMADYVQLMRASRGELVPTCHFTAMEFHECDSDPSGRNDGYQCRHCGHTESSAEAWAKVEARNQGQTA